MHMTVTHETISIFRVLMCRSVKVPETTVTNELCDPVMNPKSARQNEAEQLSTADEIKG